MELSSPFMYLENLITNNWINLSALIVTAGVGYYQYSKTIGRKETKEQERITQAKNTLISIMEDNLINDKRISPQRIEELISAAEREYEVPIESKIYPLNLLQDLMLKIETSPHLDSKEVETYTDKIQDSIEEIRQDERLSNLSKKYEDIIADIRSKTGDEADIDEELSTLEEKLIKEEETIYRAETNFKEIYAIMIPAIFAGLLIFSFASSDIIYSLVLLLMLITAFMKFRI